MRWHGRKPDFTTLIVRACGALLVTLALVVMVGSEFHNIAIVRISPVFEPMKLNTAVWFLLCGIALISSRRNLILLCTGAVVAFVVATLGEYVFHVSFGIDTLLGTPFTQKRTLFPGRPAPNTCCAFLFSSVGLMLLLSLHPKVQKVQSIAVALLASLVIALGSAPIVGYVTGTEDVSTWGVLAGMALLTAVGIILLGSCLLLLAWRRANSAAVWFSIPVFLLLFTITLSLWQSIRDDETLKTRRIAKTRADAIAEVTQNYLQGLNSSIQRMGNRWDVAGGVPEYQWRADAIQYLKAYPVLRAMSVAGPDSHVRWFETIRKDIKPIPNLNLGFEPKRHLAIEKAKLTRQPQITDIVKLLQGGKGYIYLLPLYVKDDYQGLIATGFDIDELFGALLANDPDAANFNISVEQGDQEVFHVGPEGAAASNLSGTATAQVTGQKWRFIVSPTAAFYNQTNSHLSTIALFIGLVISLLSALAVWLAIKARHNTQLAHDARDQVSYFIKHVPAAIAICDRSMRYIIANDRWYEDFRLRDSDIIGKSHYEVFPHQPMQWWAILDNCLQFGVSSRGEDKATLPSGKVMWMRWDVRPWHESNGAIGGLIMATEITTERKQVEEALRDAQQEAIRANAAKSDFLANMSHEIRTPMNGIIGMTHLLRQSGLKHQQTHYADTIAHSAESLLQIINDILDFSKIEAGKMELEAVPFDARVLFEEIAEIMAIRTQEKNVEFFLRYRPGTPSRFIGDPGRLRQILFNLCGNAVKFTERGHVLLDVEPIEVTKENARVRISVRDTGIGIAKGKQADVFGKFSQADSSTTRKYGGTGLGLAIARQLTEMMNGEITLESEPGKGTSMSFEISLPIPRGERASPATSAMLKGMRALVVDDNNVSCEIFKDTLASAGIEVTLRDRPADAIALLQRAADENNRFDFLILDFMMPGMTGLEMANVVKAMPHRQSMHVVLTSSNPTRSDGEDLKNAKVGGYLVKPVRPLELLEIMTALAERKGETGVLTRYSTRKDDGKRGSNTQFQGAKILVAEDNQVNQEVLTSMLASIGIESVIAPNGKDAVVQAASQPFDLIIMDCQMPEMDGFAAVEIIRKTLFDLPIVALTANAMKGDRERCLAAGMNDYLSKPIMMSDLTAMLAKWLPNHAVDRTVDDVVMEQAPESHDEELIDLTTTAQMRAILGDKFNAIIETFFRNGAELMAEIEAASEKRDRDRLVRAAHSLKSSSGQLGAKPLQAMMASLEATGREGEWAELTQSVADARKMAQSTFAVLRVLVDGTSLTRA